MAYIKKFDPFELNGICVSEEEEKRLLEYERKHSMLRMECEKDLKKKNNKTWEEQVKDFIKKGEELTKNAKLRNRHIKK